MVVVLLFRWKPDAASGGDGGLDRHVRGTQGGGVGGGPQHGGYTGRHGGCRLHR